MVSAQSHWAPRRACRTGLARLQRTRPLDERGQLKRPLPVEKMARAGPDMHGGLGERRA